MRRQLTPRVLGGEASCHLRLLQAPRLVETAAVRMRGRVAHKLAAGRRVDELAVGRTAHGGGILYVKNVEVP